MNEECPKVLDMMFQKNDWNEWKKNPILKNFKL